MKKNKLVDDLGCQEPITATDGRSLLSVISYMYVYVIGELSLLNKTTKGQPENNKFYSQLIARSNPCLQLS